VCYLPNHRPSLEALANQIFDSGDSPQMPALLTPLNIKPVTRCDRQILVGVILRKVSNMF